mmetsp:Transcript_47259/g.151449  ORF Transcript_47259/g.151449 Transcript_47259/m.151449 type:complete len:261 (-) Transcript_47259:345-1127(-)
MEYECPLVLGDFGVLANLELELRVVVRPPRTPLRGLLTHRLLQRPAHLPPFVHHLAAERRADAVRAQPRLLAQCVVDGINVLEFHSLTLLGVGLGIVEALVDGHALGFTHEDVVVRHEPLDGWAAVKPANLAFPAGPRAPVALLYDGYELLVDLLRGADEEEAALHGGRSLAGHHGPILGVNERGVPLDLEKVVDVLHDDGVHVHEQHAVVLGQLVGAELQELARAAAPRAFDGGPEEVHLNILGVHGLVELVDLESDSD